MGEEKVKSLTPEQAYEMLSDDPRAVLIDVRSNMEFLFVGHPRGAISLPWIDEPDWIINPHFATEVRKLMLGGITSHEDAGSAAVVLICRSGKRSLEAGAVLTDEGFTNVYNVLDGFEGELDDNHHRSASGGWRHLQLPWEQC